MEKLLMCRICLATDLRMDCIVNTHLQDTYERLTMKQFETKDSRPILACYLCCARLQNCYQLSMNCLQSEEILTQMLSSNMLNPKNLQEITRTMRLGTTPVIVETFGDALLDAMDGRVKVEPSTQTSGIEVEVKMVVNEVVGDRIPEERIKEEPTIGDSFQGADPEDDIPLDIVKHEPGIITPGMSIFKDKKPAKQRENLQDSKRKLEQETPAEAEENVRDYSSKAKVKFKKRVKTKSTDTFINKPYTCSYCRKAFVRRAHLIRHIYTHTGERPIKCNLCDKSFTCKSNLTSHIVHNHTHEKPFACNKCDEAFMVKTHLNRHIVLEHVDWKRCLCEYCSEIYACKSDLKYHVRSNHGEKPFKCDLCNKCYARNSDLLRHYPMHSGKKEYNCDICNKSYTRRRYYVIHYRIHTGEKPYKCDICKKNFRAKSHVLKHIRNHMRASDAIRL